MLTFRMCATLEFNRPIDSEQDYISPGGYEMTMLGRDICFDFEEYYGSINKENPCLLEACMKNPDFDCFEDLALVTVEMLENVENILEFYIYTGEDDESDLEFVGIKELYFVLPYEEYRRIDVPEKVFKRVK